MKCPKTIKLPLRPKDEHQIIDEDGVHVGFMQSMAIRDYIVYITNRRDKLVKHLKHIDTCLAIMANTQTEEGLRDLPELSTNVRKYIEQALKAEKE